MRYENPLYMAEEAAAADLISAHSGGEGRLQLGVSRGSPEPALNGAHTFGFVPPEGETDADLARAKTELFRAAISGAGVAPAEPPDDRAPPGACRSSRSRPDWPTASGGAAAPARPRSGPPSRA